MATTSEARALPFFTDLLGQPLSSGFIYIGQAGLDPIAYPAVIHSDIAGTIVVAQPVRTTNGHAAAAGSLIHLFVPIPYSITILDSAGRLVYASLNETDPVAISVSSSSVQSAPNLAALRARSGASSNQVWVTDFGMYVYQPSDSTSPEGLPFIVVGNDGSRYYLGLQYVSGKWVRAQSLGDVSKQGAYLSWNDSNDGAAYLTTNRGSGNGGTILRTVTADGSTELGRVSISPAGDLTAGNITANSNVTASLNMTVAGGTVNLNASGNRSISFSGGTYNLPSADLQINGQIALTAPKFVANQLAPNVGALALGNSTAPQGVGPFPGTWVSSGSNFATVWLWVRSV